MSLRRAEEFYLLVQQRHMDFSLMIQCFEPFGGYQQLKILSGVGFYETGIFE